MSLFVIGDTHLSFGTDKPMDVFRGWENFEEKLKNNWLAVVKSDDTVVFEKHFAKLKKYFTIEINSIKYKDEFISKYKGSK